MLSFHINSPSHVLSNYFDEAIDNAIGSEIFETHGVHLNLKRRGDSFMNIDGDVIFINTIADINVFKDIGLFSSEIKGIIDINLVIKYDLSSKFKLTTKTEILNYKWVEKPQLEVGTLNLPVGKLVELALQHYESIITAKIDASIVDNLDVEQFIFRQVAAINEQLASNAFNGLKTTLVPKKLLLERPSFEEDEVRFKGGVSMEVFISDQDESLVQISPTFEWIDKLDRVNIMISRYEVTDKFIRQMFLESIVGQNVGGKPLEIDNLSLVVSDNQISMKARILSPIKGNVALSGNPVYIEATQVLEFRNQDFHIQPDGLIYKLSAPLVNKFIEAKIQEFFPLDIARIINRAVARFIPKEIDTNIASISPSVENIKLNTFNIQNHRIEGTISVRNPHLVIQFKSESA
jgi:hypothetical protein